MAARKLQLTGENGVTEGVNTVKKTELMSPFKKKYKVDMITDNLVPISDNVVPKPDNVVPKPDDVVPKSDNLVQKLTSDVSTGKKIEPNIPFRNINTVDKEVSKSDHVVKMPSVGNKDKEVELMTTFRRIYKIFNLVSKPNNVVTKSDSGVKGSDKNVIQSVNVVKESDNIVSILDNVVPTLPSAVNKDKEKEIMRPFRKMYKVDMKMDNLVPKPENVVPKPDKVVLKLDNVLPKLPSVVDTKKNELMRPLKKIYNLGPKSDNVITKPNNVVPKSDNIVQKLSSGVSTDKKIEPITPFRNINKVDIKINNLVPKSDKVLPKSDHVVPKLPLAGNTNKEIELKRPFRKVYKIYDLAPKPDNVVTKSDNVVKECDKVVIKSVNVVKESGNVVSILNNVVPKLPSAVNTAKKKEIMRPFRKMYKVDMKMDNLVPKSDNVFPKSDNVVSKPDNVFPKLVNVVPKFTSDVNTHKQMKPITLIRNINKVDIQTNNLIPKMDGVVSKLDNVVPKLDNVVRTQTIQHINPNGHIQKIMLEEQDPLKVDTWSTNNDHTPIGNDVHASNKNHVQTSDDEYTDDESEDDSQESADSNDDYESSEKDVQTSNVNDVQTSDYERTDNEGDESEDDSQESDDSNDDHVSSKQDVQTSNKNNVQTRDDEEDESEDDSHESDDSSDDNYIPDSVENTYDDDVEFTNNNTETVADEIQNPKQDSTAASDKNTILIYGPCRCCLKQAFNRIVDVPKLLHCLNITPSVERALSVLVCDGCEEFLQQASKFRDMVAASETVLLTRIQQDNNDSIALPTPEIVSLTKRKQAEQHRKAIFKRRKIENETPSQPINLAEKADDRKMEEIQHKICTDASTQVEWEDIPAVEEVTECVAETVVREEAQEFGGTVDKDTWSFSELSDDTDSGEDEMYTENKNTTKRIRTLDFHDIVCNWMTILENSTIIPFLQNGRQAQGDTFMCIFRDAVFNSCKDLREHMFYKHINDTHKFQDSLKKVSCRILYVDISQIQCTICDLQMYSIDNLVEHLVNVHRKMYYRGLCDVPHNVVPFDGSDMTKCHVCLEGFASFTKLRKHMYWHYGSRLCAQCGTAFINSTNLSKHMQRWHKLT